MLLLKENSTLGGRNMNRPKVFINKPIPQEVENYIATYCDYSKWNLNETISRESLLKKLSDVDGLLTTGGKIDEELLSHAHNLKVVSNMSVGYNNFDLEAMKNKKVIGTNTPYVLDDTVADLIFGLILSTARRICELDSYVRQGNWTVSDEEVLYGTDVHLCTLGIIGMGRIGESVAKRAKFGFDMEVLYHNRNRKLNIEEKLGVKYSDFESLLKNSDFIVLMTPLTEATCNLIGYKEFELMKKSAIFINASRGQTVNEDALIDALQNKKILAAGLDVYKNEPINNDNPLLNMPNTLLLPHIGSATERTRFNMAMTAAENLIKALLHEVPPNIVPELKL
jgi:gluconate 2-dehydrogenase